MINGFSQGSANCASALSTPITTGTLYANQTTCGNANNFNQFDGQDKLYTYCATQSGCVTINLTNMESGDSLLPCRARIRVYDTCISSSNSLQTLVGSKDLTLPALTYTNATTLIFNVVAGRCYYILFDEYDQSTSYADCMYYDFQLSFSPNLTQTPGASTCAASRMSPTPIGASFTNQTLCCTGNNFAYSAGNDWFYTFCPTADGCIEVNIDSIITNDLSYSYYNNMRFYIYDSCNYPSNTYHSSSYISQYTSSYINSTSYKNGNFKFEVEGNKCYTIVFTSDFRMGEGGCIDYNFSTLFTPKHVQYPGGIDCPSANAQPVAANTYYGNQSICNTKCESTQEWYYQYCATADGCGNFLIDSITDLDSNGVQSFYLYKNGSRISYTTNYINPSNNGKDSLKINFTIDSGACYCLRIQSSAANCINYGLYLNVNSGGVQSPGGNTVPLAQTQPVTLGNTYTNQTTCCMLHDFGQDGEDWIYTFTPNKDGCIRVAIDSFINGNIGKRANAYLTVQKNNDANHIYTAQVLGTADIMNVGPELFLNVDSGALYEIRVDGNIYYNYYDVCYNYDLTLEYYDSTSTQLPGGNTIAVAKANPLVPNTLYTGQTTCCMYNDQTQNKGQDWLYSFCSPDVGCYDLILNNIVSGDHFKTTYYYITVYDSNNLTVYYYSNNADSTFRNDTLSMYLDSGMCYTVSIDADHARNSYFNCINYDVQLRTGSLGQFPGGNDTTTAKLNANQLVYNVPYLNQTTCCKLNDYTRRRGQDWYYAFRAPQSGNYSFRVFNDRMFGSRYSSSYYYGLMDSNFSLIIEQSGYVTSTLDTLGSKLSFCADSGQLFYFFVDDYQHFSYGACLEYAVMITDFYPTPNSNYPHGSSTNSIACSNPITNLNTTYDSIPFCCGDGFQYFYFQAPADGCMDYQLNNINVYSPGKNIASNFGTSVYKMNTYCQYLTRVATIYDTNFTTFNVEAGQFYRIEINNSFAYSPSYLQCAEVDMDLNFRGYSLNSAGGLNATQAQQFPVTTNTYYTNHENCIVPCGLNNKHEGYDLACLDRNVSYHDYTYFFNPGRVGKYILSIDSITSLANTLYYHASYPLRNKMQVAVYKKVSNSYPFYENSVAEDEMTMRDTTTNETMTLEFFAQSPTDSFYIVFDASNYYYWSDTNCYTYNFEINYDSTVTLGCNNSDFETGNTNGWTLSEGLSIEGSNTSACPSPTYSKCPTIVPNGPRHTVVSGGTDYYGGFPRVNGGAHSLKLGDSLSGGKAEAMEMKFLVNANNANFQYSYAVVFQDPGHQPKSQPFFRVRVKDANDELVQCTEYCVSASSSIPGFSQSPNSGSINVIYKPWDTVQVDLSAYIGTIVTVEIENGDCSDGGHFGYSYFDASCSAPLSPSSVVLCANECDTIFAPSGYTNYQWMPGGATTTELIVCPSVTTTYTLTYETYSGCILTKDFVYTVPEPFTLSDTTSCVNGGSATVNVAGNLNSYFYNWNSVPVQTTQTATNLSNGTYTVIVTDSTCYTDTLSVNVVNALPVISTLSLQNIDCFGNKNGQISVNATSTFNPCTYVWDTNQALTSSTISNLDTGSYTVTATDTLGCSVSRTYIITSPLALSTSTNFTNNCDSTELTLVRASVSGGTTPYAYNWQSNLSTVDTANYLPGVYTLQITDSNNCNSSDTFNIVTKPNSFLTVYDSICQGQTYLGYFKTGIYKDTFISNNGCDSIRTLNLFVHNTIYDTITTSICQGQSFHSYTLSGVYTDTFFVITGCDSIRTLFLTVHPIRRTIINDTICQGQSYLGYTSTGTYIDTLLSRTNCDSIRTLNLLVNPTYLYDTNVNVCSGNTYFVAGANQTTSGIYFDSLLSKNGCDSVVKVNLTIKNLLTPKILGNKEICEGDSLLLYTGSFPHYQWSTGDTTDRIVVYNPGKYVLKVQDEDLCVGSDSVIVTVNSLPFVEISYIEKELCKFDTLQLHGSGPADLRWYSHSLTNFISDNSTIFYKLLRSPTTIYLKGTDANNCANIDSITLFAINCCGTLYTPNSFTPNGDGVNDKFKPLTEGTKLRSYSFEIFNRWGERIFQTTDLEQAWDGTHQGEMVQIGTYNYVIRALCTDNNETQLLRGSVTVVR
ncbi:MAG: gliding motility-associated C-terminal domain-containing protein [Flavobacteriales bacterium]